MHWAPSTKWAWCDVGTARRPAWWSPASRGRVWRDVVGDVAWGPELFHCQGRPQELPNLFWHLPTVLCVLSTPVTHWLLLPLPLAASLWLYLSSFRFLELLIAGGPTDVGGRLVVGTRRKLQVSKNRFINEADRKNNLKKSRCSGHCWLHCSLQPL